MGTVWRRLKNKSKQNICAKMLRFFYENKGNLFFRLYIILFKIKYFKGFPRRPVVFAVVG